MTAVSASFATDQVVARRGGPSLDGLRFAAALFILLFHYGESAPVRLATLIPVFGQGWLATDFFLMLSGFVLARAYGERLLDANMRRSTFFLKRFARLWPSHAVVLGAFALFIAATGLVGITPGHPERYGGRALFAQAFLVHGWGQFAEASWNVPTWTLSALLICYGLFSFYVPWVFRRSGAVLAALAVVTLVAGHLLAQGLAKHAFVDLPFAWGLLRAIPLFVIGSLIERLSRGFELSPATFWWSTLAAPIVVWGLLVVPRNAVSDSLVLVVLAAVLVSAGAVRLPESSLTQALGRSSFALFLTHSLVGAVWFGVTGLIADRLSPPEPVAWALWGAGVAAAIVTAFVFDALIDRPLSRWVAKSIAN